jgi:alpha-2-macroglobulin
MRSRGNTSLMPGAAYSLPMPLSLRPRQWITTVTVLAVVATAAILAWQGGGIQSLPSPESETAPSQRHERIGEESPLRLRFPVPMDAPSVEENLTVEPALDGSVEWEDARTLALRPAAPLDRGGSYTLTVAPEALRRDRSVLGRTMTVRYFVAGPPSVSQRIPPPASDDVALQQPVTMIFDRPMVALTTLSERASQLAEWPVTIAPTVAGSWKWISTTTVQFTPREGLAPGTEYRVSVPAGIATLSEENTAEDFSWTFTTRRPKLISTDPPMEFDRAGPKTEVVLRFNQEIDLESAKQHIQLVRSARMRRLNDSEIASLQGATPSPEIGVPVAVTVVHGKTEVNGNTVTNRTTVVLIPSESLLWNAWHTVLVGSALRSPGSSLGTEAPATIQFRTAGTMEILSIREQWEAFVLDFTNPYDAATVKKGVTIIPKPRNWDELKIEENLWGGTTLYLYPELEPSTEYTVTVTSALKDTFGQSAASGKTLTVKTKPLPPRVFIHSSGTFGVFEKGFLPVYYLNAVNVSKLDVAFAKLSLGEFLSMQRSGRSDWQYAPALEGKEMFQTWTIVPGTKENEWRSIPFDLEEKLGKQLAPGIYALTLSAPEYKDEYSKRPTTEKIYFTVSQTALTLKHSGHQALVWAVDMKTGEPLRGAEIALHDLNGKTLKTGKTDGEGFFETEIDASNFSVDGDMWNPEIWVSAKTGDGFAFVGSAWGDGMRPYDFGFGEDFFPKGSEIRLMPYLYTDRPIYRAGDTVHFKGILRLRDGRGNVLPPKTTRRARMTINDAEGSTIYQESLPITLFGSFSGKIPLDPGAKLGTYSMEVHLEPGEDVAPHYEPATFQVLAYRKPEFRVDVTFDAEEYFAGDTAHATVEGAYYFGMPMDRANVAWRALTTDYFFNRVTDGWYSFSLEGSWCWYDCQRETEMIASGEGTLGADGRFAFAVPMRLEKEALSQVLSVDVDITDVSNQVVSARASVPVHTADVYVGIRAEDYVVEPGDEATLALITVKPDGSPIGGRRVDLTVFERNWNTIRKKGVDGQYYYDNEPTDRRLSSNAVTTGPDGKAIARVVIPKGGHHRILAVVRDSRGREAKADASVYAWSRTFINWPHSNSHRMTVLADKPEYEVGDTAKLLVQSPYQGSSISALVTVEREGLIKRTVIPIESSAQPIDVPITEDLIPNAYVSVVVIKPRVGETFNEHGLDTGAPAFRIGYAKLKVENAPKGITVSVEPDKRRYLPGETVEVTLRTADHRGNPVSAELSLGAVDMSVLALTGFRVPDLLAVFYSDRGIGVRSAVNLLYLLERFKPGSKGGGGADPEERARGNFKDTAYWNPVILTDEGGTATVRFTLPDNLTTWQLLAIAHTRESLVGARATEILETKRVIVRPVRPRFAVHGDRAELAAIVHNGTEQGQEFSVSLTGKGFASGRETQRVSVPAGGHAKVAFPVTFGHSESAEFVFIAEGADGRDEVHETIPLHPLGIPAAVATAGFTEESATEHLFVPLRNEITGLKTVATLSPTLATYLPGGLQYLVQFPYGCAEQTVSSFLPNIAVARLQGFDAFRIVTEKELREKVTAGIERLLTFQRADGGFGYWVDSRESHPYLTAYILHALHHTQEAGYTVDGGVLSRARSYLQNTLRGRYGGSNLAERAYILYVLGESGNADASLLSNLYGNREELPLFAKAYLAMSLQKTGDDRRALALLQEILAAAKTTSRGTHFEEKNGWAYRGTMHTDTRTTAIVLQAILRIDPSNALAPRIVRALLTMRHRGHWDTTQSTVQSIFGLVEYLTLTRELEGAFTATVSVDGEHIAKAAFDASTILTRTESAIPPTALDEGQMNRIAIDKDGPGRLYYDFLLTYFWKAQEILPAEEGISVMREITPVAGSLSRPTVGGTYKVKLTITVPEHRYFVAVESPHPAGFEGIDFTLQTTQRYLEEEAGQRRNEPWWWDPSWIFNHREFRDDQVFLFADELPAGVYHYEYLVRATLPGTFQWRPARAYEMYFPEVFGNTENAVVEVTPEK